MECSAVRYVKNMECSAVRYVKNMERCALCENMERYVQRWFEQRSCAPREYRQL